MYIINGSSDTLATGNPEATGNYMNLTLCETYEEAVYNAKSNALMQIWLGGRDIDQSSKNIKGRTEYLDTAKKAEIAGENTRMQLYAKAAGKFCEAQCYAQLAQKNPYCIEREGGDY